MTRVDADTSLANIHVLLVDDDTQYLTATEALLRSEGYCVATARNAREALAILAVAPVNVAVVDYALPEVSGADLIEQIRAQCSDIRIVLQTGSLGDVTERDILKRLDVHGLAEKSDGPERLLLWTEVAAKAALAVRRIRGDAESMRKIAEAAADFHRMKPVAQLGVELLASVCACLAAQRGLLVMYSDILGFGDDTLDVHLGRVGISVAARDWDVGACTWPDCATDAEVNLARLAMRNCRPEFTADCLALPLVVRDTTLGFVLIDGASVTQFRADWLELLAYQVSVALQNAVFYEMAAFDALSGVHARRFFENWVRRELHASLRNGTCCGLLYADLDGLKHLNDSVGHLYGDAAIRMVGVVLRHAIREHDIVGRIGGDEFAVVLPTTDEEGARSVGERILELLSVESIETPSGRVSLTASIGIVVMNLNSPCDPRIARKLSQAFYDDVLGRLMIRADEALYAAKAKGGAVVCVGPPVQISTGASEQPMGQIDYEIA